MPREPKAGKFVIHSAQVDPPAPDAHWTLIDRHTAVPRWFRVTFQLEEPTFLVYLNVGMEGTKPIARRIEIVRGWLNEDGTISRGDGGVTTTNLRQILVDRLVRRAVELVRRPAEPAPEGAEVFSLIGIPPEEIAAMAPAFFRVPGVTPPGGHQVAFDAAFERRERDTTADRIMRAVEFYKRAIASGSNAPVKDVGIALGYSTSQASRYLKAARERGLLRDVEPAGEQ